MTDTTTIPIPIDSFTGVDGSIWTMHDLGNGRASITSTRRMAQPEREGQADEVRLTFERWRAVYRDGIVTVPEGHRSLRERMEAGEPAPSVSCGLETAITRKATNLGRSIAHHRIGAELHAQGWTVPLLDDPRTDEDKARDARADHEQELWSLELLEDDEVCSWWIAAQPADAVEQERADLAEMEAGER